MQQLAEIINQHYEERNNHLKTTNRRCGYNLLNSLGNREIGGRMSLNAEKNIYDCLLHSSGRNFQNRFMDKTFGKSEYHNCLLFFPSHGSILNHIRRRVIRIGDYLTGESYNRSMYVYVDCDPNMDSQPVYYIAVLTSFGRLIIFDIIKEMVVRIYQLPANLFLFDSISYSEQYRELCIIGKNRRLGYDSNTGHRPGIIITIDMENVQFKMAFTTDEKFFAHSIIGIADDALFVYDRKTKSVSIFDVQAIYKEFCFQITEPESSNDMVSVRVNTKITSNIEPLARFVCGGNPDFLGLTGDYLYTNLGRNIKTVAKFYKLKDLNSSLKQINDLTSKTSKGSMRPGIRVSTCDSRIIAIQEEQISCYNINNAVQNVSEVNHEYCWTRYFPSFTGRTTDGRHLEIRAFVKETTYNYPYVYVSTEYDVINQYFPGTPLAIISIIDINTGELVKSFPVCYTMTNGRSYEQQIHLTDYGICLESHGGNNLIAYSHFDFIEDEEVRYKEEQKQKLKQHQLLYCSSAKSHRQLRIIQRNRIL